MTNPLADLEAEGQAVWLDYLHCRIIESGELARLIETDGLTGLTSNPAIFEQAIGKGADYDDRLRALIARTDGEIIDLYEALAIADIQAAADAFRPTWDRLAGADGFVSLEVSPHLAMDTEGTIAEARRLWRAVDRPNLMIKVPGTGPGVPAVRTLIGEGINVNVTLLFGIDAYLAVAEAHMAGLEDRLAAGGDVKRVRGVASFFVSRIDAMIDKEIDRRLATASGEQAPALRGLRGKVAIANAKLAYRRYGDLIASARWRSLARAGAAPQRLLWASTGVKDPSYSDVLYVEQLIGPDTVNTVPPKTLDAFRDHGVVRATLTKDVDEARRSLEETDRLGLDLAGVTEALAADGVAKFADAFDALLGAVAEKRAAILGDRLNRQTISLPTVLEASVEAALAAAATNGWTRRLWSSDALLWTGADEAGWLGWLGAARGEAVDLEALDALRAEVEAGRFRHALVLGMGGSSLGPEVLAATFGSAPGFPELVIVDSTDPDQIARIERMIDPGATLYVVASKSGSTLEPDLLHRYFFARAEEALGAGKAGPRFIAITDPGSKLEQTARREGFGHIFHGRPDIGGRYSVLSNFGMVPAAVIGLDARTIFAGLAAMVHACGASAPPAANPGFQLGVTLGVAAKAGRDKVTLVADQGVASLGAWLEQLLAESTGKQGRGLIPIDAEPTGPAETYGGDRLFVHLALDGADDPATHAWLASLEAAGHPVVRIGLPNAAALFQEFFRWEVATAVAGAVIGVDPFDQPDVEASKLATRALTDAFESTGALPSPTPVLRDGDITLYADAANAAAIAPHTDGASLPAWLAAHLARAEAGDYVALLAWLDRNDRHTARLQAIRGALLRARRVATALGFGPRFLHSTGQAYKGGPASGVFLQITATPRGDLAAPGRRATFGAVEAAQAQGDFEVLSRRGRRLLRVHLEGDVEAGLARLADAVDRALG